MSKLRSPEEIKASNLEATAKYLEHAESTLSELLGQLFGQEDDRVNLVDDADGFLYHGMELRAFVMALRRYPTFDPACLTAMKKFTYVQRVGSVDVSVDVMVPTFGVASLFNAGSGRRCEFNLLYDRNQFEFGKDIIGFSGDFQAKNIETMRGKNMDRSSDWTTGTLAARVPVIPNDVQRRTEEARPIFGSQISVVWEAEWGLRPIEDPLIVGHVFNKHFLIDQYDVTKLERYISSEMTRGPLK
jgi:hypothetical protein